MHYFAFLSCLVLGLEPTTKLVWYLKTDFSLLMGLWSTHSSFQLLLEPFNAFASSLVSQRSQPSICRANYWRAQFKYKRTDCFQSTHERLCSENLQIHHRLTSCLQISLPQPLQRGQHLEEESEPISEVDRLPGHTSLMQRYQLKPQLFQQTLCHEKLDRDLFYSHRPTRDTCSLKQAVFRRVFPCLDWAFWWDNRIAADSEWS